MAPEASSNSQISTICATSKRPSACRDSPATTKPSPRVSALVSACRRLRVSGKRSSPTLPAAKNSSPPASSRLLRMSSQSAMATPPQQLHQRDADHRRQQRQYQRRIAQARLPQPLGEHQEQRRTAGAQQLHRQQSVDPPRPAPNAPQAEHQSQQQEQRKQAHHRLS